MNFITKSIFFVPGFVKLVWSLENINREYARQRPLYYFGALNLFLNCFIVILFKAANWGDWIQIFQL